MDDQPAITEVIVELNAGGGAVWRARVDALGLRVKGDTVAAAEAAALVAIMEAGATLSDDLVVRVRFGTRAQRLAAGWVPPAAGLVR